MSSYENFSSQEVSDKFKALQTNVAAIKAIASAVEGTLGPKGLDTMLVDSAGEIIITNDGVTILNKTEVSHPAAKMLIQVARSQQQEIGDGTTTATILASELLYQALNQVNKGVPIQKIIKGIKEGIKFSLETVKKQARPIKSLNEPELYQIAYVAGREQEDVARLIVDSAKLIGKEKLFDSSFKFAETIVAHEGSDNELISGLIIGKKRMNTQMPERINEVKLLIVQDALEPEGIDDEALGTEVGFSKYLEYKEVFTQSLDKLIQLGVNALAVERNLDPIAEEFCIDHGILVIQRLLSKDLKLLAELTGAKAIKRTGLHKDLKELKKYLGYAKSIYEDERLQKTRVIEGKGKLIATILVGASTNEIVGEMERMAKDAAASVQATVKGGYVPGGGAIELFISQEIENYRRNIKGMEGFGLQAVADALRKPMSQILINAGFNALEKIEQVKFSQIEQKNDGIGVDVDTGELIDMVEVGVIDPALVKIHALKTAGEITEAILRIHTIIKMKNDQD